MEISGLGDFLAGDRKGVEKAAKSLLRILNNILETQHQQDSKFRRLNISSDAFTENILSVPGALDLLFEVGFQEDPISNEHLIFPFGNPVEKLQQTKNELESINSTAKPERIAMAARTPVTSTQSSNQATAFTINPNEESRGTPTQPCSTQQLHLPNPIPSGDKKKFRDMMISYTKQVLSYEDSTLQAKIRNTIPVSRLKKTGFELAKQSEEFCVATPSKQEAMTSSCFLLVLLKWFKEEFFQWVNQPKCENCHGETSPLSINSANQHLMRPTPGEVSGRASRVELYWCQSCQNVVRFPRFNDPLRLLDTRRGRCGEWANCFTAICRAVGFEARYVQDNADHVWTEVFSPLEDRWLHCDSCEASLDQPLIYESGWGKKLSYVFACSRDEIADVSWRYSVDHGALRSRRSRFSEMWLMDMVQKLNTGLQSNIPEKRKSVIRGRRLKELVEFLVPNTVKDGEKVGRISGSLTWRLSRGEMGPISTSEQPFVIIPNEAEIGKKFLKLVYDASSDSYHRGDEIVHGFKACAFKSENISKKVEQDWRMAYLARVPGSVRAEIVWKVDCTGTAGIKQLQLRTPRAQFESGQVVVSVDMGGQIEECVPEYFHRFLGNSVERPSVKVIEVRAVLTDGNGTNAWQHTQLFRESLDRPGSNAFQLEIELN